MSYLFVYVPLVGVVDDRCMVGRVQKVSHRRVNTLIPASVPCAKLRENEPNLIEEPDSQPLQSWSQNWAEPRSDRLIQK